jgi:hypothetical protein
VSTLATHAQQQAAVEVAFRCFRDAGKNGRGFGQENHCCVTSVDGRWYWTVQRDGDYLSLGGMRLPLSTDLSPCDEHVPLFEEVFGS